MTFLGSMAKIVFFLFVLFWTGAGAGVLVSKNPGPPRFAARDIELNPEDEDWRYFSMPTSLRHDRNHLFVLDVQDHDIKVFSKTGAFEYTIGKKGQGPGEFYFPKDLDIHGDRLFVTDGMNKRIQILDRKGVYSGGFKLKFSPDMILVLDDDRIVTSHLPWMPAGHEPMIRCFDFAGNLIWEKFASFYSGDSIYDTFRNMIIMMKGPHQNFFVVRKSDDRHIHFFDREGRDSGTMEVSGELAFKKISIPVKGKKKEILGFCQHGSFDKDMFYLLLLEYSYEGEKDLGPGREIAVVNKEGRIEAFIDLPDRFKKISVENDRIYGIDKSNTLRIMEIERK